MARSRPYARVTTFKATANAARFFKFPGSGFKASAYGYQKNTRSYKESNFKRIAKPRLNPAAIKSRNIKRSAIGKGLGALGIAATIGSFFHRANNNTVEKFNVPSINGFTNNQQVQLSYDNQSMTQKVAEYIQNIEDMFLNDLLETIKARTPVDTGTARDGWYRDGMNIANDVPYIEFLEVGTVYNRPIGMIASTMADQQRIFDLSVSKVLP